jgi:hypothetical protein
VRIEPLDFYSASGRFDFLTSASAHLDSSNRYALSGITVREKLRWTLSLTDQARLGERFFRNFGAFWKACKVIQTHDLVLDAEDVGEPALWNAARERHLSALELRLTATRAVVTSACLDSLVSFAGSLSGTGARSTTESLAIPV